MRINELTDNTITLYRGDSSIIQQFSVDASDDMALFGIGIYLTDNKTIAADYTLKSSQHVLFKGLNRDDVCLSKEELISLNCYSA